MRKILLILDGIVAKQFLESLSNTYIGKNVYDVVYMDDATISGEMPEVIKLHKFDPTSFSKLLKILDGDISEVFIILRSKEEVRATFQNIRKVSQQIKVTLLDEHGIGFNDKNISTLDAHAILSRHMIERLPDVPATARNVGLGQGEIMEVSVPYGSSYVYRSLGSIQQKNWRIVGIFRSRKLLIAKDSFVIQPNDSLLIIGEPNVLKNIYKAIKRELGQFPSPFGNNIYLLVDMHYDRDISAIYALFDEATALSKRLNTRKLIVRVLNPASIELCEHLKKHDGGRIDIQICYRKNSFFDVLRSDKNRFSIGLVVASHNIFAQRTNRRDLYLLGVPVLKVKRFVSLDIRESIVTISEKKDYEQISPIVFDISSQLDASITIYDYNPGNDDRESVLEHYENLSRIYSKKAHEISTKSENPIKWLKKKSDFLHIIPFTKEVVPRRPFWYMSTDVDSIANRLEDENQLFVPIV